MKHYSQAFKSYIQRTFQRKIDRFKRTVVLEIVLTTDCRNDCLYCGADIRDEKGEVNFVLLKTHILNYKEFARNKGSAYLVSLVGADIFLYTEFEELLDFLKTEDIAYLVKCNTSTLTRARARRLKETGCTSVKVTCCGEAAVHNSLRGLDTFVLLCERTKMAQSEGLKVIWHLTVGPHNIDSVTNLIPFIYSFGVDGISEGRIALAGKAEESHIGIAPERYRQFLLSLLHYFYDREPAKFNLTFREKLWVPLLVEEGLLDLSEFANDNIQIGCDVNTDLTTIDFRGYLKGCSLFDVAAKRATPGENRIKFHPKVNNKILVASELKQAQIAEGSPCKICPYYNFCRGCRAITLANTGNIDAQDPQCWVNPGVNQYA